MKIRSIIKYWLPYGLMRRYLARTDGMVVHKGRIVARKPEKSDISGFALKDFLPLWVVMFLQRHRETVLDVDEFSELDMQNSRICQLVDNLGGRQTLYNENIESLETENLKLRIFVRDVARIVGMQDVEASSDNEKLTIKKKIDPQSLTALYSKPNSAAWDCWRLMDAAPLKVDMICSLGGDCIAASQQKLRGLRPYSLPFDWCFSDGAEAIRNFATQLDKGFSGFALRENLVPIPGVRLGYKDRATGYNFMHHFQASIETKGEYERFRTVLTRRMDRFYSEIERSKTVLFLLSRTYKLDERCLDDVERVCRTKWPNKKFFFILATYNSMPSGVWMYENRLVVRIPRDRNSYDMKEKVFEWSFLDNVSFINKF